MCRTIRGKSYYLGLCFNFVLDNYDGTYLIDLTHAVMLLHMYCLDTKIIIVIFLVQHDLC